MARPQPPQYRPKRNASRQEWYLYAVNRCRYTDEMETMRRDELIALVEAQQPALWPDVDDEVEHEDIRNAAGQTRAEMAARDTGAHVFRWAISDLAEFIDKSGTDVPQLPPRVEMKRFVEQIVDDAQTEGRQVCALIRDHDGRLTKVLGYADGHSRVDVEEKPTFVDWGSSEYPDERVRADRRAARAGRPDPVGLFLEAAWTWLRDNIVAVWATILVIGAIIMIGANPAVGAVSIGVAAAVVLPIAIPLHRRHRRRQLLDRMQAQHQLWMTDPTEYRRRVERGEL
ncbi:membrane protein [Gordonia Phage Sampson]|uniref:Uncharacterized protein n=3 Tax=Zitchvirus TaxID=2948963 RepID=A0A976U9M5_9CAUD|nr:membrane protein [Gordonia Phage Sampson]UVF61626.1 hypothetical protein SEA_APUNK_5 [Gordonia phage APunk]UVG34968.1 membrane protein [Gordonia phage ViaConlectus]